MAATAPPAATGAAAAATATLPAPTGTGPGGHTQRLLTVVKSGSIQQTRAEAQDKVHTWPHLLVIEFAAVLVVTRRAHDLLGDGAGTAARSRRRQPDAEPVEGAVVLPRSAGAAHHVPPDGRGRDRSRAWVSFLLIIAPYVDKNPSHKPNDRKFAIAIFTIFVMFWAVLVIIGSFFRGPGFNFVFPWKDGIFFEL